MGSEWIDHLALGAFLTVLGIVAMLFMVYRELGPGGGLSGRGRLFLTLGLGLGVVSFGIKVVVMAFMAQVPEATLAPLMNLRQVERPGRLSAIPEIPGKPLPQRRHYVWETLPDRPPHPPGNPVSAGKVALGKRLFHDRNLSADRTVACASCHDVEGGAGTDGRATSAGIGRQVGRRNAPTVWNAAFQARLFWDGRAPSLEEQAKGPPVNPIEMGMPSLAAVERRVAEDPGYRAGFARVYGGETPITIDHIAGAIASYERTLVAGDTPYDRFVRGDGEALGAAQLRGMALFEQVGCVVCHSGPNFSGASLFDRKAPYRLFPAFPNAVPARYRLTEDTGRLSREGRRGLWRVPSLRNVALTAPYFHNGSVDRLEDAVRIMAMAQLGQTIATTRRERRTVYWSAGDRTLNPTERRVLGEQDVRDIAAFLGALSSDRLAAAIVNQRGKQE